MAEYKNQLVLAKAFLPIYPSQTKPKQKSRKSRQLEVAANKPGQKKIKSFFPSSVKTEPENGVGMVNVAKTEPPNRKQKRKLSSSENEDSSGQNTEQTVTPEIEIDDVESEYTPSKESQNLFDDTQIDTQPSTSSKPSRTVKPRRRKIHESMNSQRRRTNKRNKDLQGLYKDFKKFTSTGLIEKNTIGTVDV